MTSRSNGERGSALVLALIVLSTVVALGLGYLQVTKSVTDRQMAGIANTKAFYLAEAGLAEAFHAVRMGRTGQIGAEDAPARHGEGLLWVEATGTADDQVRLESTALVGSGRKTLALIVEPVEIPLGFFSDEDLVVESVLLVDGYDSGTSSYEGQTIGQEITVDRTSDPYFHLDKENSLVFFEGTFYRFYAADGATFSYDEKVSVQELSASPTYGVGTYYDIDPDDFTDTADTSSSDPTLTMSTGELAQWGNGTDADGIAKVSEPLETVSSGSNSDFADVEYEGVLDYFANLPGPEALEEAVGGEVLGATTGHGGLLSSNGDVRFVSPTGESVQVFGDVMPGPGGSVDLLGDVAVTGDTTPRLAEVELPPVSVPDVVMAAPVRHEDVLPMLVSPGTSGHERIVVAADSELILRGPSTVVIGELVLEPGAWLSLDTRDGDVSLFVTEGLDLQPDSVVTTSSDLPEEVAVQVDAIVSGPDGAPVKLEATSRFHGTVYAPATEVLIGSDFEIFGGVVASKLEIGAGARLHFDGADYQDSPLPRFVSWRVVEIPAALKARLGNDPFAVLGVQPGTPAALAESHDLASVTLSITYLDLGGVERSFEGTEDGFDWHQVSEVLNVARVANRTEEEPGPTDPGGEEPTETDPARDWMLDGIATKSGSELKGWLLLKSPLNDAEMIAVIEADKMSTWELYDFLLKTGPSTSGYPGGQGDTSLSDGVLLDLIQSGFPSKELGWALEQNSPLSDAVLQAALNRDPPMGSGDESRVLGAQ